MEITSAVIQKKFGKEDDPLVCGYERAIVLSLKQHGIKVLSKAKWMAEANEETLFIALGGDGTMLTTARVAALSNSYVVGFNLGHLGFLTEFQPDLIPDVIRRIVEHDSIKIEERMMLRQFCRDVKKPGEWVLGGVAFNDIVVSNRFSDSLINYQLHIGETGQSKDNAGKHASNSLIISSPTGSTAYSLNAGGAIVSPSLDVMQIVPVAALGLTTRPIIVSGNSSIIVAVQPGVTLSVRCDGQEHWGTVGDGVIDREHVIKIKRDDSIVRVVHDTNWNFYKTLTEKLHWNRELF